MKAVYSKPSLLKRGVLSQVTAMLPPSAITKGS
jgi:hypothetical protein